MCDTQVYLARIYSERERCVGKELERARTERRLGGLAPGATAHLEASSPINCVIIAYIRSQGRQIAALRKHPSTLTLPYKSL